ncbi:JmjC domain-containing protein [Nocardia tengchongensis]
MTDLRLREATGSPVGQLFARSDQAAALSWGNAPSQFAVSEEFRRTLAVDDVETWVDCSLLQHPFFKVFLDGMQVPVRLVASPRSVAGQSVNGFIDSEKTRDIFAQGGTLMLCNMHEWHPPCRDLCRTLTGLLVAEVKATAFYSPAGCQGLLTHRDDAHVFVAQLDGEKRWSVFDLPSNPRARRIGTVDQAECGPEQVVNLRPGDGLYLPPYAAHHARAQPTSSSLHLSIHVREPRGRDVVDTAIDAVMTTEMQRAELSGNAAARAATVADILTFVAQRLTQLDPADVVAVIEDRVTGK